VSDVDTGKPELRKTRPDEPAVANFRLDDLSAGSGLLGRLPWTWLKAFHGLGDGGS